MAKKVTKVERHRQMKTRKTYRISDLGLQAQDQIDLKLNWAGYQFQMALGEIWEYAIFSKEMKASAPIRAELMDGRKVGIFATIKAKSDRAAGALSILHGAPIEVGDGWSFSRQSLAERELCILVDHGISLDDIEVGWMIGTKVEQAELPLQGGGPRDTELMNRVREAAIKAQLEDSPF